MREAPEGFVIRSTTESDWPELRAFRIENATEHPVSYGATLETTFGMDEDAWRLRARRGDRADAASFVAIELATGRWVGMMSAQLGDEHGQEPVLTGVYVSPAYRGHTLRLADALLDRIEAWARGHDTSLRLFVFDASKPARRFYARRGFVPTGLTLPTSVVEEGTLIEMSLHVRG